MCLSQERFMAYLRGSFRYIYNDFGPKCSGMTWCPSKPVSVQEGFDCMHMAIFNRVSFITNHNSFVVNYPVKTFHKIYSNLNCHMLAESMERPGTDEKLDLEVSNCSQMTKFLVSRVTLISIGPSSKQTYCISWMFLLKIEVLTFMAYHLLCGLCSGQNLHGGLSGEFIFVRLRAAHLFNVTNNSDIFDIADFRVRIV